MALLTDSLSGIRIGALSLKTIHKVGEQLKSRLRKSNCLMMGEGVWCQHISYCNI